MAGLEVLNLLHEPTAAAVIFCFKNKSFKKEKTLLVFDLGGGTFDVVVMTIKDGNILIKAIGGDSHLGGQDIDRSLVDYCLQEFKAKHGIDLSIVGSGMDKVKVARLLRRIKNECEEVKIQLSRARQSEITLINIHGDNDLSVKITREKFENLADSLFQQCVNIAKTVVIDAKLTPGDIDEVIMVGGSSRIPKVQELIMGLFQDKKLNKTINADEAVACGAAIQAALMTTDSPALRNIFPDIKMRDAVCSPLDTKQFTTLVSNTLQANSVFNNDIEIPNLKTSVRSNVQVGNSQSNSGKDIPKQIFRKNNEVEKPDEISVKLQIIQIGLVKNDNQEITDAWWNIRDLTEENPGNCERFLEHGGIKVFLHCFHAFPNDQVLKKRSLWSLINVAEVEHLRPQLMTSELINVFYNFLDSTEHKNWVSYLAAWCVIHVLSDGVDAWTVKSPRRADVLNEIRRMVKRLEEDQSTYLYDSDFLGQYLNMLNVTHTTECQLFSTWSLKNLTKHWPHLVPELVEKGGLDILNKMSCEDEDVLKYVNMTLKQTNDYLSRNKKN